MCILKKEEFNSVSKDSIPTVIPTKPENVSPLWDKLTAGMTEEEKDSLRKRIKEVINRK